MSDITSYIDWKKKREIINTEGLDTLKDDTVKGVLRSIGDAGDNPINATGETVLSRLKGINDNLATRASEATLSSVDTKLGSVDSKLGNVDSKLGGIDTKLGGIDTRLSSVDTKLGNVDSKLGSVNSKLDIQLSSLQRPDLFTKEINVGTTAVQVDTSTDYRKEVILLAKKTNTDDVLVGTSTAQVFPLEPGAAVGIMGTALNKIYLRAVSGTQKVYVLAGGS